MSSNGTASTSSFFESPQSSQSPPSSPPPTPPSETPTESSAAPTPSSPPASPTPSVPSPSQSQTDEPSPSADPPTSSQPPEPSSSQPPPPSTSNDPPPSSSAAPPSSSAAPPSSSAAPPSSEPTPEPSTRSTVTAPSAPPSTKVITSVVTPSPTKDGETPQPSTVVVTLTTPANPSQTGEGLPLTTGSPSSTSPADLQRLHNAQAKGGLSTGGKIGIAVAVPVVVVALLVFAGILLWRKRKQRKHAEEARRKEVEEYGFNPNNDPTLPAVGIASEMSEDQSGYRGWGNTTTSSNRKASTTLTSGMTYSDSNSNPGGPNSPTQAYSDNYSNDPLVNGRRETLDSEGIGALGAAPAATQQNQSSVHRGPSNASSSYSAANHSDNSGDYPIPMNNPQDYYDNNNYYHATPYNDGYGAGQQPIIRDVSARRNTRIENPSVFPHQGNSGIAQNF